MRSQAGRLRPPLELRSPSLARVRARAATVWPPPPTVAILTCLMGIYVVVFGTLTWRQQSRYGTFGFDMGIYDQGIWLLSRLKEPFVTVRGLNYFGHHFNPITLLFVPFYWLGAGPHFLYLVQTIWMALGAIPVWLLARHRLHSEWTALPFAAAFLLYPSLEWINWWHFHPDALSITPLLFAYFFGVTRRWRPFWVAIAVTLLCKEDAALAVFVLGLVLARKVDRRMGLFTAAAGLGWFVMATRLAIPFANGGRGPFYESFFPGLGNTLPEIAFNVIVHPTRVLRLMFERSRLSYYARLLGPVAFMPFAALPVALVGAPQLTINAISGHSYTHEIKYHYSSLVIAAVFISTVEGCARISARRLHAQTFIAGLVLASSLASNFVWSPSPLSTEFHKGIWAARSPRQAIIAEALSQITDDRGVSAIYYLVPQLTHRVYIYEFPNPFRVANWGIDDTNPDSPDNVDWIIVDRRLVGQDAAMLTALIGQDRDFQAVYERDGIVVAHRRR